MAGVAARGEVALRDLLAGQVFVEDVLTTGGMLIVPRGAVVTAALL